MVGRVKLDCIVMRQRPGPPTGRHIQEAGCINSPEGKRPEVYG